MSPGLLSQGIWGFHLHLPERSGKPHAEKKIVVASGLVISWGVWQKPTLLTLELRAFNALPHGIPEGEATTK